MRLKKIALFFALFFLPWALPCIGEEVPSPLPPSHEMTLSYESAFIRMLLTLGGLILLVVVTVWVLRRLGTGKFNLSTHRSIQILEKRPLSPKTILYLIEINRKKILIAESQLEVRQLSTLDESTSE